MLPLQVGVDALSLSFNALEPMGAQSVYVMMKLEMMALKDYDEQVRVVVKKIRSLNDLKESYRTNINKLNEMMAQSPQKKGDKQVIALTPEQSAQLMGALVVYEPDEVPLIVHDDQPTIEKGSALSFNVPADQASEAVRFLSKVFGDEMGVVMNQIYGGAVTIGEASGYDQQLAMKVLEKLVEDPNLYEGNQALFDQLLQGVTQEQYDLIRSAMASGDPAVLNPLLLGLLPGVSVAAFSQGGQSLNTSHDYQAVFGELAALGYSQEAKDLASSLNKKGNEQRLFEVAKEGKWFKDGTPKVYFSVEALNKYLEILNSKITDLDAQSEELSVRMNTLISKRQNVLELIKDLMDQLDQVATNTTSKVDQ